MKKIYKLVVVALIVCFSTSLRAQTAGTLTFKFTELSHTGYQGNNHTLVVWIESAVPSPYNTTEETTHMSAMSGGTAVTSGTTHHGTLYTTHLRYCCGGNTTDHIPQWRKLNANSTTAATANGLMLQEQLHGIQQQLFLTVLTESVLKKHGIIMIQVLNNDIFHLQKDLLGLL